MNRRHDLTAAPTYRRRSTEQPEPWLPRRSSRCADCGQWGERTGHMGCQYPGLRSER